VPLMFIWTLKFVMLTMVGDTVRIMFAAIDAPGWRSVSSLFHATVIGPFAAVGVQLLAVMLMVSERPVLVFLM